jgi:hypothetical protein
MSEESLEHFMFLQRERLASRLQRMENRIYDARLDGMTRGQALTETSIERRG